MYSEVLEQRVSKADLHLCATEAFSWSRPLSTFCCAFECTFILGFEDLCVWGAVLCWLSHIQQCCCGCKTASGISMYKQAYKWSTIWLFIFILLTVNKAEQALTPSNKWRPTHANSAAARNRGGLLELRSILFRLPWSLSVFFCILFVELFCEANHVFMYSKTWCNECDCVCLCCVAGFYGEAWVCVRDEEVQRLYHGGCTHIQIDILAEPCGQNYAQCTVYLNLKRHMWIGLLLSNTYYSSEHLLFELY